MKKNVIGLALLFLAAIGSAEKASAQKTTPMNTEPSISIASDWKVRVASGKFRLAGKTIKIKTPQLLWIALPEIVDVRNESYEALPLFNAAAPGWLKGMRLRGVVTMETTALDYLDPGSVSVSAAPGGEAFTRGTDYEVDTQWGTIGRLPGGKIGAATKVFISYKHGLGRLDSVVASRNGRVFVKRGQAKINLPHPPELGANEVRLANIWVFGRLAKLTDDNIFPISEGDPLSPLRETTPSIAEKLLPKTLAKLRSGAPLKILAWGDSVTAGGYLASPSQDWQQQFVARLRQRFPAAKIELVTNGWGGRNTQSFLDEPTGSPYNYRERVLGVRPDLVISEFVNDAYLGPAQVEERYGIFLRDFNEIGAEWIIQTPHYVTPVWMGLNREKGIDDDPRPYVIGLREFAAKHNVALADASLKWGRLWRRGLPYTALLVNQVNHPDERGMALFADALMELFPQK